MPRAAWRACDTQPELVLIYESETVGTKPSVLPLSSIGDGELAETADCVVPLPEIFSHYLLSVGALTSGFLRCCTDRSLR